MRYEEVAKEVGTKGAVTLGSGTAFGKALDFLNEYGVGIGVLLTLIFGGIGWYYNRKEDKRRELEHQEWMKLNGQTSE